MAVTGTLAAVSMFSASQQAEAQKNQADFQASQNRFNAELNDLRREDILDQGEKDAQRRRDEVGQILGTQRVNLAAQGIEIDSDVALQAQEETIRIGNEDAAAIKNNAYMQAWGLEVESQNLRSQANMDVATSRVNATNTLIAGGANAASTVAGSKWFQNKMSKPSSTKRS